MTFVSSSSMILCLTYRWPLDLLPNFILYIDVCEWTHWDERESYMMVVVLVVIEYYFVLGKRMDFNSHTTSFVNIFIITHSVTQKMISSWGQFFDEVCKLVWELYKIILLPFIGFRLQPQYMHDKEYYRKTYLVPCLNVRKAQSLPSHLCINYTSKEYHGSAVNQYKNKTE